MNTGNRWGNGFFRACRDFFNSPNNEDDPEDAEYHQYVGMMMTMEMRVKTRQWDSVIMVKTRLGQADLHQDNRGALDSAVGATK